MCLFLTETADSFNMDAYTQLTSNDLLQLLQSMSYAKAIPYEIRLLYYRNLSLQGQPRRTDEHLDRIFQSLGIGSQSSVGLCGYKYFEAAYCETDPVHTFDVPAYIVDLLKKVCGSLVNSTAIMESLLRKTLPTDDKIYCGHKAAMDSVPYQLDPAALALKQPRQRILIADAVGLGKTLECGLLLSELIRRGKGRRILVVTVKSMAWTLHSLAGTQ